MSSLQLWMWDTTIANDTRIGRAAFALCLRIFTEGKRLGCFRLPFAVLVRELGRKDATAVVKVAAKLYLVKNAGAEVRLTAAGIDIAKRKRSRRPRQRIPESPDAPAPERKTKKASDPEAIRAPAR